MSKQEKYVFDELFSILPNWLIHFLWYLFEDCRQNDAGFDGRFKLQRGSEGQHICYRLNGQLNKITMQCPCAVDADVVIVCESDCLVMRLDD